MTSHSLSHTLSLMDAQIRECACARARMLVWMLVSQFLRIHKFLWWTHFTFRIVSNIHVYDVLIIWSHLLNFERKHDTRAHRTVQAVKTQRVPLFVCLSVCLCLYNTCSTGAVHVLFIIMKWMCVHCTNALVSLQMGKCAHVFVLAVIAYTPVSDVWCYFSVSILISICFVLFSSKSVEDERKTKIKCKLFISSLEMIKINISYIFRAVGTADRTVIERAVSERSTFLLTDYGQTHTQKR